MINNNCLRSKAGRIWASHISFDLRYGAVILLEARCPMALHAHASYTDIAEGLKWPRSSATAHMILTSSDTHKRRGQSSWQGTSLGFIYMIVRRDRVTSREAGEAMAWMTESWLQKQIRQLRYYGSSLLSEQLRGKHWQHFIQIDNIWRIFNFITKMDDSHLTACKCHISRYSLSAAIGTKP